MSTENNQAVVAAPGEPEPIAFRAALHRRTPRALLTWILLAANVAVFVAMAASGAGVLDPSTESLIKWGANYGPRTVGGQWWRLVTATFEHIGLVHLVLNMMVLWSAGPFVERLLGRAGFGVMYLLAGLGGSVASVMWNPEGVSAGASGAIFGIYGALVGYLVRLRGHVPPQLVRDLGKSAFTFIAINVAYGASRTGIDMAAHAGGLVAGCVAALALAQPVTARGPRLQGRALVVLVAGLALVAGVCARLPRPVDLIGEEQAFLDVDSRAVEAYNAALKRRLAGGLDDAHLAEVLERTVLPPFSAEHTRVEELGRARGLGREQRAVIDRWARYMDAREQAFRLTAKALRSGSQTEHQASLAKEKEAERVLDEMKAQH